MDGKHTDLFEPGPAPKTNTIAIVRALTGDAKARAELLERYWGTIYIKFYDQLFHNQGRLVGDRDCKERAKDLTQAFIAAFLDGKNYLNLEKFDPQKGRFRSLLKQSVVFFFQDAIKRDAKFKERFETRKVPPFVCLDELAELADQAGKSPDPETCVDEQWARDALRDVLAAFYGICVQEGDRKKGEILYHFLISKDLEALKERLDVPKPRETVRRLLQEFKEFIAQQMPDEEEREMIFRLVQGSVGSTPG